MTNNGGTKPPIGAARFDGEPALPKRFYSAVEVAADNGDAAGRCGFRILLDQRAVRTPGKQSLLVPSRALAEAIAQEWQAQQDVIDPATMPLTKIANTTIDGIITHEAEVRTELVKFAGSDLLCYRAEHPQELVEHQSRQWDPLLAWAAENYGISLQVAGGVMPVRQAQSALDAVAAAWADEPAWALGAAHVLVTLTGSSVLALACRRGRLAADAAWSLAHVDEDWQIAQWGDDAEAAQRRERRRREFLSAARFLELLG